VNDYYEMNTRSLADAIAYRDAVLAREQTRLGELAGWMAATGGPLERMDASLASLDDLWTWYVQFARNGYPGVPATARHMKRHTTPDGADTRDEYAHETVAHYLKLVAQRVDPVIDWHCYTWKPVNFYRYHDTGLATPAGGLFLPELICSGLIDDVFWTGHQGERHHEARRADALGRVLARNLRLAPDIRLPQERGPGVLPTPRPVPDPPPILWVPVDPPVTGRHRATRGPIPHTTTAVCLRATAVPSPRSRTRAETAASGQHHPTEAVDPGVFDILGASSDLNLWRGPVEALEDPAQLKPMPLAPITTALTALGFTLQASEPDQDDTTCHTWTHLDAEDAPIIEAALLTRRSGLTRTAKALSLQLEFHEHPPAQASAATITALTGLAARLKARLVSSDHLDD